MQKETQDQIDTLQIHLLDAPDDAAKKDLEQQILILTLQDQLEEQAKRLGAYEGQVEELNFQLEKARAATPAVQGAPGTGAYESLKAIATNMAKRLKVLGHLAEVNDFERHLDGKK